MSLTQLAIEVVTRGDRTVLYLRGNVGIGDAPAVREAALRLATAPPAAGRGAIDLSEIESLDVSILQILAACEAEFERRGRLLEVDGLSEPPAGWCGFRAAS